MGQGASTITGPPTTEQLTLQLTNIFAEKCLSSFELYSFKEAFKSIADEQSDGVKYWSEATFIQFLDLQNIEGSGKVLYELCTVLGAFPFPDNAPVVLTGEALLRVLCLLSGRYMKVFHSSQEAWRREIWRASAVSKTKAPEAATEASHETGAQAIGIPSVDEGHDTVVSTSKKDDKAVDENENENGELAKQALAMLGAPKEFEKVEKFHDRDASIPREKFIEILHLLLLLAPLKNEEVISLYTGQLDPKSLESVSETADCIIASFGGVHTKEGVTYETFEAVLTSTLPHLFDVIDPLFEHLLYPKEMDDKKGKSPATEQTPDPSATSTAKGTTLHLEKLQISTKEPLLPTHGNLLDVNLLSQLSFIFSGDNIFHRLRPLYLGQNHGYSMGSFEKSVFKWNAPSILLVSGTILSPTTRQSRARTFLDDLPYRRLNSSVEGTSDSSDPSHERIIYGAYLTSPWEPSKTNTFGNIKTTLFQLSPVHDVFPSVSDNQKLSYFNKPPSLYSGLGFGSPVAAYSSMTASSPTTATRRASVTNYSAHDTGYGSGSFSSNTFSGPASPGLTRRSSLIGDEDVPLGPVSLHINDALEFGVFTHLTSTAGSFQTSKLPVGARPITGTDWQDRFEIEAIEVWGVGDASVAEEQRQAWMWEVREAERRKQVNLGGTGDIEADRELLRMAGIIKDDNRTGGSMN